MAPDQHGKQPLPLVNISKAVVHLMREAADPLCVMLQADFFGLPGLADKASVGLEADPSHGQEDAGGPGHAAPSGCQYDSVYLETGFQPAKSEFNVLQQQQAATMEVTLESFCTLPSRRVRY